ncbi:hypothetical protein [Streptomyces sp. NPDC049040]|uniref:hypothetical protein n=1 Tax=Streptomyces sp. NPDC049040 TaxID=3365593 RepID=UPI00370FB4D6
MHARTATATAGAAVLLAAAALTGCGGVDRALDCARTATTVAGDIQDLQSTATNIGQVSDPGRRHATVAALDKVHADLRNLGGRTDDSDLGSAISDLDTAVRDARASAAKGDTPDLHPVARAAGHLTDVCTPG